MLISAGGKTTSNKLTDLKAIYIENMLFNLNKVFHIKWTYMMKPLNID